MGKIKVKNLLALTGGSTKIIIYNLKGNKYKELWAGKVDDLNFDQLPYAESEVEHISVVEDEDVLQIHIEDEFKI